MDLVALPRSVEIGGLLNALPLVRCKTRVVYTGIYLRPSVIMGFLEKICHCFDENSIPYAIVGGYAVALHGAPRGTFDIDFIISLKEDVFIKVEAALLSLGFLARLPVTALEVFRFRKEYIENRNLIAWSFYNKNNPIEVVDIVITENLDNFKAVEKIIKNFKIKILSKADLIYMKRKSGRRQDIEDINALEKLS